MSDRASWIEDALFGEHPTHRDEARAQLIRHGKREEIQRVIEMLGAPLKTTRRRASRLLAELQPQRALPSLEHLAERLLSTSHDEAPREVEILVSIARLLTTLSRSSSESLGGFLEHSSAKVRRASITPALPADALICALDDDDLIVVERAAELSLRREHLPTLSVIDRALARHPKSSPLRRLLALTQPHAPLICEAVAEGDLIALSYCEDLTALEEAITRWPVEAAWAIGRVIQKQGMASPKAIDDSSTLRGLSSLIDILVHHEQTDVRAAVARHLPKGHPALERLMSDADPSVRWLAQRTSSGRYTAQVLTARLQPHARLKLPSAEPPYGLRPHDKLPQVERIHAAIALCHARFDVNVGVAMRSAEAAGLEALYIIGERMLATSPTRGAELAIPLHHTPDPATLILEARRKGYQIVAIQQTPDSVPYHQATYPPHPLFVLGSEDSGLPDTLRKAADLIVEIPLYGLIDSLNVATAATCVIMHWRAHHETMS